MKNEDKVKQVKKLNIDVYELNGDWYLLGNPSDFYENEEDHNCDVMGCGLDHVIAIFPNAPKSLTALPVKKNI